MLNSVYDIDKIKTDIKHRYGSLAKFAYSIGTTRDGLTNSFRRMSTKFTVTLREHGFDIENYRVNNGVRETSKSYRVEGSKENEMIINGHKNTVNGSDMSRLFKIIEDMTEEKKRLFKIIEDMAEEKKLILCENKQILQTLSNEDAKK